jgi:hypothetical protein
VALWSEAANGNTWLRADDAELIRIE